MSDLNVYLPLTDGMFNLESPVDYQSSIEPISINNYYYLQRENHQMQSRGSQEMTEIK